MSECAILFFPNDTERKYIGTCVFRENLSAQSFVLSRIFDYLVEHSLHFINFAGYFMQAQSRPRRKIRYSSDFIG